MTDNRHAPKTCPVCSADLTLTRLSCDECGTELAGHFITCEYCSLDPDDRQTLRVFLASRGNMKELERHLGVSYPTARTRFDALLSRLGLDTVAPEDPGAESARRVGVLEDLASGDIDVSEALDRLRA
jgi:hypothetical protein